MVTSECETDREGGVTLVRVVVTNGASVPRTVRVESRLDGPTLPPRRAGVPTAGWNAAAGEYEGVVPADGRLAVGFASPAPPVDPAVVVHDEGRAPTDADGAADGRPMSSPAAVVRELGAPAPPRDAVPAGVSSGGEDDGECQSDPDEQESRSGDNDGAVGDRGVEETTAPVPSAVASWLDDVAARARLVERASAVETLEDATAVVSAAGSLAALEAAVAARADDRAALRAVERRVASLRRSEPDAEEACAADAVPLDALRRLA